MREIKFRAWYYDEMYEVESINFFVNPRSSKYGQIESITIYDDDAEWKSKRLFTIGMEKQLKKVRLMQYIGLKDKNGVEIYEEDIAKSVYGLGKVFFEDGKFKFGFDTIDGLWEMYAGKGGKEFEIVGNIYENPELIKD